MNEEIMQTGVALMQELSSSMEPISAAKLCKRLGIRMSSLQRCLAYFGVQQVAGQAGLGLIHTKQEDERLLLSLSAVGRAQWEAWQQEPNPAQEDDDA